MQDDRDHLNPFQQIKRIIGTKMIPQHKDRRMGRILPKSTIRFGWEHYLGYSVCQIRKQRQRHIELSQDHR